jgi:hypothetical protein
MKNEEERENEDSSIQKFKKIILLSINHIDFSQEKDITFLFKTKQKK